LPNKPQHNKKLETKLPSTNKRCSRPLSSSQTTHPPTTPTPTTAGTGTKGGTKVTHTTNMCDPSGPNSASHKTTTNHQPSTFHTRYPHHTHTPTPKSRRATVMEQAVLATDGNQQAVSSSTIPQKHRHHRHTNGVAMAPTTHTQRRRQHFDDSLERR